ncbi:deoxycytidylate deaminase-like [Haliotis cracherodii]|uniref:deoxycytidylate deaminase-like n=1 Tax=Haliotis cracherodii TaxID=6455 RepID=UPI0039E9CEF0
MATQNPTENTRQFGESGKRESQLDWEEYFMAIAFLSGMRSKDPVTQVGACIVNSKKRIVGTGYNGMPNNCSDTLLPWNKKDTASQLGTKYYYVCHAEMNAVINKFTADLEDCTMYVCLFPCNECAKIIIQSGIKTVVYYSDKKHDKEEVKAAKILFEEARVETREYNGKKKQVMVDFQSIEDAA